MDVKAAIAQAGAAAKARAAAVSAWARQYRTWVLTVATVLSILLIVWARLGFTFQVGRFFAQSAPTDPNGNCVFKTNFNAPEGAWFCTPPGKPPLQCQLDGNPSQGQEYPPKGLASRLQINMFGTRCGSTFIDTPTVGCVQRLDATPKCSGGGECFPPKDPLWSCTGPIEMGRNGSDFYDCYVPLIHLKAPGQVTCTANTGLPGDSITFTVVGEGGATPAPTPIPPGTGEPAAGELRVVCTGGSTPNIAVQWSKSPPPGQTTGLNPGLPAVLNRSVDGQSQQLAPPPGVIDGGSYWQYRETAPQTGKTYIYRGKYGANVATNPLTFVASPENCGVATPTPTAAPTATPAPLSCSPPTQTVQPGQPATFQAAGGAGIYVWTFQNERREGNPLTVVPNAAGTYTVAVSDGVQSQSCTLVVAGAANTGTDLALRSSIRNFTNNGQYANGAAVRPGQQVQVRISIEAIGTIPNVVVKAALPDTLTYVPSSTTVAGVPASVDAITQGGLAIGSLTGSREVVFVAKVKGAASLPAGTLSSSIVSTAKGDGAAQVAGQVTVTINNAPAAPVVSTVRTGPGEATILALMISALLTLLYVSYTHSSGFRSREAQALGEKHDPLDFTS